ncbi:chromobox protein homolog 1-like [Contarinia nasturtii]|uniref:chromobox protein homolog 1-like n=1 Tax=Contarinia nasturtii TaxID=265458 RepID=UPI0012D37E74|nr:chromobox protein homolog 1-like [Contarinia nasturtii]
MSGAIYEVESIIDNKVEKGKEKFRVKWKGFSEKHATWEPIENLFGCLEMVEEYQKNKKKALDQIIGCGQRNGKKYFLVRFKHAKENELIDWDTAKQYSLDVMEYFGSRLVWNSVENLIDPDVDDHLMDENEVPPSSHTNNSQLNLQTDIAKEGTSGEASTSGQSNNTFPPNDIEYEF